MNMDSMKPDQLKIKKIEINSIKLIIILIILGIITGLFISNYYLDNANEEIDEWNERIDKWQKRMENKSWYNKSWSESSNQTWNTTTSINETINTTGSDNCSYNASDYNPYLKNLEYDQVILQSIACILLCIASYILLAVVIIYIKIYQDTHSKYIQGLLFVIITLFVITVFLVRVVKSLYFATATSFDYISNIFGFGISGFGTMLIILSIVEIIGLSKLLDLSMK